MRPRHHNVARGLDGCRGQAMIESCFVIIFLCLLFLGLFQLIHGYVAREILYHAAACAARAKTVGFNGWMVKKTMRVAAIPNAGSLTQPVVSSVDPTLVNAIATLSPGALWDMALTNSPQSPTISTELTRIPDYLTSQGNIRQMGILDYANWDSITCDSSSTALSTDPSSAGTITMLVHQPYALLLALETVWSGDLTVQGDITNRLLNASYTIESHYPLYLDDRTW